MFGVKENECVGFESRWKVKKVSYENGTQTANSLQIETGTNTVIKCDTESQTDNIPKQLTEQTDMQKLADFLAKVYPMVKKNIDDVNNSQAFKNYTLHGSSLETEIKLLTQFNIKNKDNLRISALSWNSTGKSLAVSCNHVHKTWCLHSGFINIYSFNRNDELSDTPRCKLTTETCVTTLKFHPILPAVIAAGTYSGDILVWNINYDGNNTPIKINAYNETITQVSWINDINVAKSIILATSSLDGFLNLWYFSSTTYTLQIKHKYKFKPPLLAKSINKNLITEDLSKKIVRGVICFDFSIYQHDMFVVGLEGGLVAQCSMLGANKLKGSTDEIPILDPVFKYYKPLEGEIMSIAFSPNRKDIFMTNSCNSVIRLYVLGTDEPAKIIYSKNFLNAVSFIPHEEKLLAGCGKIGLIELYNILNGKKYLNTMKENAKIANLMQMAINYKRPLLVAVGNDKGEIQLLRVPWRSFSDSQVQFV